MTEQIRHCSSSHSFMDEECLYSILPTAPHSCDVPDCPGQINKRKLEAIDALLSACQAWLNKVDDTGQGNCCGCHYEDVTNQTRAAIAAAKEG